MQSNKKAPSGAFCFCMKATKKDKLLKKMELW